VVNKLKITLLTPAIVQYIRMQSIQSLAALYQRTMQLSVTITGNSAYVAAELGECEVSWVPLQA
jgi:uncharacterized protein YaeQ